MKELALWKNSYTWTLSTLHKHEWLTLHFKTCMFVYVLTLSGKVYKNKTFCTEHFCGRWRVHELAAPHAPLCRDDCERLPPPPRPPHRPDGRGTARPSRTWWRNAPRRTGWRSRARRRTTPLRRCRVPSSKTLWAGPAGCLCWGKSLWAPWWFLKWWLSIVNCWHKTVLFWTRTQHGNKDIWGTRFTSQCSCLSGQSLRRIWVAPMRATWGTRRGNCNGSYPTRCQLVSPTRRESGAGT